MNRYQRHASLDLIRGIAILAILLVNIWGFAMPLAAYNNPTTSYILSSVLCTLVFNGHGLGLFGQVDRVCRLAYRSVFLRNGGWRVSRKDR